jgi:hypothetical protein
MNKISYYKIKNITEVHVFEKQKEHTYHFREVYKEKKWWFSKPTYHYNVYEYSYELDPFTDAYSYRTAESILSETNRNNELIYLILDNIVYRKPYVSVKFSHTNIMYHQLFDTIEEAIEWAENLLKTAKLDNEIIRIN